MHAVASFRSTTQRVAPARRDWTRRTSRASITSSIRTSRGRHVVGHTEAAAEMSEDVTSHHLHFSYMKLVHFAMPYLEKSKGNIVNVSSVDGVRPVDIEQGCMGNYLLQKFSIPKRSTTVCQRRQSTTTAATLVCCSQRKAFALTI